MRILGFNKKHIRGLAVMNGADLLIKKLADAGVSACFANLALQRCSSSPRSIKNPEFELCLAFLRASLRCCRWVCAHDRHASPNATSPWTGLCQWHRQPSQCIASARACVEHDWRSRDSPSGVGCTTYIRYRRTNLGCLRLDGVSTSPDDLPEVGLKHGKPAWNIPVTSPPLWPRHAWDPAGGDVDIPDMPAPKTLSDDEIMEAAEALRNSDSAALFMGGHALRESGLIQAGRIAEATARG